jgi:predicted transcriptional regulator
MLIPLSGRGKSTRNRAGESERHANHKLLTVLISTPRLVSMDVPLNPDLQEKIRREAAQQGRACEALIVEAVERMVNYDEWFLREVDKGIAAADRGELVDHSEVRKMIDERYRGRYIFAGRTPPFAIPLISATTLRSTVGRALRAGWRYPSTTGSIC